MRVPIARFVTWRRIAAALAAAIAVGVSCARAKQPAGTPSAGAEGGTAAIIPAGTAGRGGSRAQAGEASGDAGVASATEAGGAAVGGAAAGGLPSWLGDSDEWQPATTLPDCNVRIARDAAKVSPRHVFAPCGDGCEASSVLPGDTPGLAYVLGTAARVSNAADLDVSLSQVLSSEPSTSLVTTYTFGDGKPNLLMVVRGSCATQFAGRASPQLVYVFPRAGEAVFKVGWLEATSSKQLQWLDETTTRLLSAFDYGSSWGGIESQAEALVAEAPLSTELTSVYQSNGSVTMVAGELGVASWGEWSGAGGRIVAFAPGQPATVVATGSWYPALVGLSSTRFAWLGANGPSAADGTYATARVYWCGRTSTLGPCNVIEGPELPVRSATGVLAVFDRWLALTACAADSSGCDIYLIDSTTGFVHRLKRVAQDHGVQVIGVSTNQLFAADFGPDERGTPTFGRLLRYDLSKLSSFAVQL